MNTITVTPKNTFVNLPNKKRSHIVSVMVREFALNGYRKASLNAIAHNSGVSKGSLYQYFRSKEEMFLYIFDQFTELVKGSLAARSEIFVESREGFWQAVRGVLLAGVRFVETYPEYFQLYLRVIFEHDLPNRQELIASVRLFSKEYFSPLVRQAKRAHILRQDLSVDMVVFCIDAVVDRFLQGYAKPYLDGGLGLAQMGPTELTKACDDILSIVRNGLDAVEKG